VLLGGAPIPGVGNFFSPTVITDIPEDSRLMTEEPFGPVAGIVRFKTVDEVLKRLGSRDRSVLVDVADEEERRSGLLRGAQEEPGHFANLGGSTGDSVRGRADHRLDRVDHRERWPLRGNRRDDVGDVGGAEELELVERETEPLGAQADLSGRLLAADIDRAVAGPDE
jgi:hypothetical protein